MTFPAAKQARRKSHWAARVEGKNTGFGTKPRSLLLEDHQNRYSIRDAVRQWKHDERIRKHYRRLGNALEQEATQARSEVQAFGT